MSRGEGLPEAAQIVDALRRSSRGPLKAKALARSLGVGTEHYKAFKRHLARLVHQGRIYKVKGGRYAAPERINLVPGRVSAIRSGDAFVIPDRGGRDVFVRGADLESAMDGDRVVVRIESRRRGPNPVGRVIRVLERAHTQVVGTYRRTRDFGHVAPRDARLTRNVLVPGGEEGGASTGDLVVVDVRSYGDRNLNPVGSVSRVLGPPDAPGVDILAVVLDFGLPTEFPAAVAAAAGAAAHDDPPRPGDAGRVDRRDLHVFTIDPADARDHDDALSVRSIGDGRWEVGIHIADVSRYVPAGGATDVEAAARGTSVYLVDRVIPMLPEALSAGVCSLVPGEARFAVSLIAELDDDARVLQHRFERTLILSRQRLAYETAQAVLDGAGSVDDDTDRALGVLARLARAQRARRVERGSIDFDLPEAEVELDDQGRAVDVQARPRLEAHRLVEDFMLLANEIVARDAVRHGLPVLHRVHEPPASASLESLRGLLEPLGLRLPREVGPRDLQALLASVEGRPEQALVSRAVLRAMQRARYSEESLGHFGLATEHYCHFTSPIRRYPDLVTHRAVVAALVEGRTLDPVDPEELAETAAHASERERVAQEAERTSVDVKKVELMEQHLGESFDGTVAGVTSFGFFVLLDRYFVDGLVHVNALEDDYYEFREEQYALVGARRGRRFRLGDRLRVEVARVDKEQRHIDLVLHRG